MFSFSLTIVADISPHVSEMTRPILKMHYTLKFYVQQAHSWSIGIRSMLADNEDWKIVYWKYQYHTRSVFMSSINTTLRLTCRKKEGACIEYVIV